MENALNYLGILLNDIEQSKNNLASYNNLLLILSAKYGILENPNKLAKSMSEQERFAIINAVGMFRMYATRAFIGYTSIKSKLTPLPPEIENQINLCYTSIKSQAIPEYNESESFVQLLSNIFVDEINVQAIINTSKKSESLAQSSEPASLEWIKCYP